MSTKIYAAEGVLTFFKRWQGTVNNPSGIVNKAISRYNYLLLRSLPKFTPEEWGAIFDLLAEYGEVTLQDVGSLPYVLSQSLLENKSVQSKWHLDVDKTLDKLNALSITATVAVVDMAERYLTTHLYENVGLPVKSMVIQ